MLPENNRDDIDTLRTIEEQLHTILDDGQLDHKAVQQVLNDNARDYDASIKTKGEYVLQVLKEIASVEQTHKGEES